ncbi:MAG: inositol monophosphatase family protein [Bacteroidota bacterium]|nr:inositol monophosphatase family protein [Bacteroidota bacterium]
MLNIAIEAAKDAGKFLKQNLGKVREINLKSGQERNLVTEIDKKSEELIIGIIRKHFPTHDILAEESGSEHGKKSDFRWIIDPLDGTTNFTHGLPIFCVSIGLEHKGEIVAGVIYDPNLDELFSAEKGRGAFLNGKRLRVSQTPLLKNSLMVTGFPYNVTDNPDNCIQHFVNFLMAAQAVRRMGSAAIDLAYVAASRYDGFWEVNLNAWDMAAGVLLIREAGGKVTGFTGEEIDIYGKRVVASNGLIHDEMIGLILKAK